MLNLLSATAYIFSQLTLLAAIFFGGIYRKNRGLNPIRFFMIQAILHTVLYFLVGRYDGADHKIFNGLFNGFSLLEVSILYYYFGLQISGRSKKITIRVCYLIILGICLYFWTGARYPFSSFTPILYGVENLFIIVPCILYFYEILDSEGQDDLKTNPHFYVTCAVLFFYGTTFPFYISYKTLIDVTPSILAIFVTISSVLTMIFNLTIIKAFLCRYPEEK